MNRTEIIKWLSENTTREQWDIPGKLFFKNCTPSYLTYEWGTFSCGQHTNAGKVLVRPLGSTDNKNIITANDVFGPAQPNTREEMIKWLSENTTREQWVEGFELPMFKTALNSGVRWVTDFSDVSEKPYYYVRRKYPQLNDTAITVEDVFEQPAYIDGAVYEIGLMGKEPEQFVYNLNLNMFERGTNESIGASDIHESKVITHFKLISKPESITDRDTIDTIRREEGHEFVRGCGDKQSSNDWGKFLTGSGVDSSPQGLLNHKHTTSVLDKQEGGSHYKGKGIQPWEIIKSNDMGFFDGNALKYLMRHRDKNGAEDIKKAIHYLEAILEFEYSDVRR